MEDFNEEIFKEIKVKTVVVLSKFKFEISPLALVVFSSPPES